MRFATFGAGFWARFQLSAWREVTGAECVALYNRTKSKADALAADFGIPATYDDAVKLLDNEQLDFVDIITDVDTHGPFVELCAERKIPVICQKPMAPSLTVAQSMMDACRKTDTPFFIHENWRWQTPIREFQRLLQESNIGKPFRARIDMISGFPVIKNQPFLGELDQFILTDLGSHILDVARFLFGEADTLYCQTDKVQKQIKGEDVATVMMRMGGQTTVNCNMAYAGNHLERDRFPETYLFVEAEHGSLELGPDYVLRVTTADGTHIRRCPPPRYAWADPAYDIVHSSIVPCNANLLNALKGTEKAETSAEDNFKTVQLVFNSYESASSGQVINFS